MEKLEYEDDTIPRHVAHFLLQQKREQVVRAIEKEERKHFDDDEARQLEPGQTFPGYNFLR